ncbi:hypothetical protein BZG36_04700 [Bifiguratus adelaidae]|uniref:PX domain-containing protein n=1 Tax=Bifiguratus adelaidae TaxID=1938954 RepID=A0A261XV77_9FUNG|nr:hypothetical protein BZG36_04700 [Bifiguratus adelaidae]
MPTSEEIRATKRAELQAKLAALQRNLGNRAPHAAATNGTSPRPPAPSSPTSNGSTGIVTPTVNAEVQRRLAEVRSRLANGRPITENASPPPTMARPTGGLNINARTPAGGLDFSSLLEQARRRDFATTKANRRAAAEAKPLPPVKDLLAKPKPKPVENPYLSTTPEIIEGSVPKARKTKHFQFNKPGRFVKQADQLRQQAQLEELKAKIAEKAKKAGVEADVDLSDNVFKKPPPPDVEWWDAALLPNKTYDDLDTGAFMHKLEHPDENSLINMYIQHPVPIRPPGDKSAPVARPLMLTKKEQKKLRRQRRLEAQKDKQDKIRLGLLPPEAPKVKLANLMKVLGQEAIQDPTKIEAQVRKEMAARERKHLQMNAERKLTDEEASAKKRQKIEDDSRGSGVADGVHVVVFKINDLSHPKHLFKVDMNAKQLALTGRALVNDKCNIVIVEGGPKGIKAYKKLMLRRIDWNEESQPHNATDAQIPADRGENRCIMVWDGEVKTRAFRGFFIKKTDSEKMVREMLSRAKVEHYWDVALATTDEHVNYVWRGLAATLATITLAYLFRQPSGIVYVGVGIVVGYVLLLSLLVLVVTLVVGYHYFGPRTKYFRNAFTPETEGHRRLAPLRISEPSIWCRRSEMRAKEISPAATGPLIPNFHKSSQVLDNIIAYNVRDFVTAWFTKISPHDPSFPLVIDRHIRSAVESILQRLRKVDVLHLVISVIVPTITQHIYEFRKAETFVESQNITPNSEEERDQLIASYYNKYSSRRTQLHPALSTVDDDVKNAELEYLRPIIEGILSLIVDESEMDVDIIRVLTREIVTASVLQPLLNMFCEPDFWNEQINIQLAKVIREQNMVRKLREVLDKQSFEMGSGNTEAVKVPATERPRRRRKRTLQLRDNALSNTFDHYHTDSEVQPGDDARSSANGATSVGANSSARLGSFDSFLKQIKKAQDVEHVQRIRNEIIHELKLRNDLIAGRKDNEMVNGQTVQEIKIYLNRLKLARRTADKRIASLSASQYVRRNYTADPSDMPARRMQLTLAEVLASSLGLTYFTEFMESRGRLPRLQLWLIVKEIAAEPGMLASLSDPVSGKGTRSYVQQIYTTYIKANGPQYIALSAPLQSSFHQASTLDDPKAVAECFESCQSEVFEQMRINDFEEFRKSEIYFRLLMTWPSASNDVGGVIVPRDANSGKDVSEDVRPNEERNYETQIKASSSSLIANHIEAQATELAGSAMPTQEDPQLKQPDNALHLLNARGARPLSFHSGVIGPAVTKHHVGDLTKSTPDIRAESIDWSGDRVSANQLESVPIQRSRSNDVVRSDSTKSKWPSFAFAASMSTPAATKADTEAQSLPRLEEQNVVERGEVASILSDTAITEYASSDDAYTGNSIMQEYSSSEEDDASLSTSEPIDAASRKTALEAVEAELRSIMEGGDNMGEMTMELTGQSLSAEEQTPMQSEVDYNSNLFWTPRPIKEDQLQRHPSAKSIFTEAMAKTRSRKGQEASKPLATPSILSNDDSDSAAEEDSMKDIHLAPPGDLLLARKIAKLDDAIDKILQQQAIVDSLVKKAEKQVGRDNELRILQKSSSALRRELQQMEYQKSQYELQENENTLIPGRSTIEVPSCTIAHEGNKEYTLYVIEVHQLAPDGNYASGWVVPRRYSEFWALHQHLKERYPIVRQFEFPGKRATLMGLQRSFVESRRIALEKYLQALVNHPDICHSEDLKAFLSQQTVYLPFVGKSLVDNFHLSRKSRPSTPVQASSPPARDPLDSRASFTSSIRSNSPDSTGLGRSTPSPKPSLPQTTTGSFMKHIYKAVAEGIDDLAAGESMLDIITQRLGQQVLQFAVDDDIAFPQGESVSGRISASESVASAVAAAAASLNLGLNPNDPFSGLGENDGFKPLPNEALTPFTEPLCDLFIEIFELKERNNWLRRQAVVIILQQILGGTIERRLRDSVRAYHTDDYIAPLIGKVSDAMWPNGVLASSKQPKSPQDKQISKELANRRLLTWLPDMIGSFVGKHNARRGARRIFTVFQNKHLNQHLIYTIFDEIVIAVFPEMEAKIANANSYTPRRHGRS